MKLACSVLLVEPDPECGKAMSRVLRRRGHLVRLARTARAATSAAARGTFDMAVVDLLVPGGGVELARRLSRRVPRLYLSVGARLLPGEIVEAAVGFPVLRKAAVPRLVGGPAPSFARRRRASSPSVAKRPSARAPARDAEGRDARARRDSRDPAS